MGSPVEAEFEAFYRDNAERLRRFLCRRVSERETRQDLEVTIMTLAWRRFHERPEVDCFGWLAGIAGGAIANERRGRRRHLALIERAVRVRGDVGRASSVPPTDGIVTTDERVAVALRELSDNDRHVLLLHDWDDLTYGEIARAIDVNEAAARKRVSRARDRFAAAWRAQAGTEHG